MAQFCGKCGAEVPVGDGFCPKCGAMVSIGGSTGAMNPAGMTGIQQPAAGGRPMAYGAQQPAAGGQAVYGAGEKKKLSYGTIALIVFLGGWVLDLLIWRGSGFGFCIISAVPGFILAIVGLVKQKDRKKTTAIITLVLTSLFFLLLVYMIGNSEGLDRGFDSGYERGFDRGFDSGYDVPWYEKW